MQQGGGGYPGGGGGFPPGGGGGYPGGPPNPYGGPPGGGYPGGPGGPPGGLTGTTKVANLQYNVAALLCYLPIFGINFFASLLWLFTEPRENKFLRFHAIQSLTLIGFALVFAFTFGCCIGFVVPMSAQAGGESGAEIGGIIAMVLGLIQMLFWLAYLGLHVFAMIKAYGNQMFKVPLLGNLAESRS